MRGDERIRRKGHIHPHLAGGSRVPRRDRRRRYSLMHAHGGRALWREGSTLAGAVGSLSMTRWLCAELLYRSRARQRVRAEVARPRADARSGSTCRATAARPGFRHRGGLYRRSHGRDPFGRAGSSNPSWGGRRGRVGAPLRLRAWRHGQPPAECLTDDNIVSQ